MSAPIHIFGRHYIRGCWCISGPERFLPVPSLCVLSLVERTLRQSLSTESGERERQGARQSHEIG
jgi:hypothetical protein